MAKPSRSVLLRQPAIAPRTGTEESRAPPERSLPTHRLAGCQSGLEQAPRESSGQTCKGRIPRRSIRARVRCQYPRPVESARRADWKSALPGLTGPCRWPRETQQCMLSGRSWAIFNDMHNATGDDRHCCPCQANSKGDENIVRFMLAFRPAFGAEGRRASSDIWVRFLRAAPSGSSAARPKPCPHTGPVDNIKLREWASRRYWVRQQADFVYKRQFR
jgi:hypothetical protein